MTLVSPTEVTVELTNACNLRCEYCYAGSGERYPDELSTSEWKQVLQQLSTLRVFGVFFGGGEPMIHPDFFELVQFAQDAGLDTWVSTNGTLIDQRAARKLASSGLKPVQVSVDGASDGTHNSIRGQPWAFRRTVEGMENLRKEGVPFQVSMTVTQRNIDEIEDLVALVAPLGANAVFLSSARPSVSAGTKQDDIAPSTDAELALDARVKELRAAYPALALSFVGRHGDAPGKLSPNWTAIDDAYSHCWAGRTRLVIDPQGDVFGCELARDPALIAGNVRKHPVQAIWRDSPVFSRLRQSHMTRTCYNCSFLDDLARSPPARGFIKIGGSRIAT